MDDDNVCGVPGHEDGHWQDEKLGIFYCPDCGTEIYVL